MKFFSSEFRIISDECTVTKIELLNYNTFTTILRNFCVLQCFHFQIQTQTQKGPKDVSIHTNIGLHTLAYTMWQRRAGICFLLPHFSLFKRSRQAFSLTAPLFPLISSLPQQHCKALTVLVSRCTPCVGNSSIPFSVQLVCCLFHSATKTSCQAACQINNNTLPTHTYSMPHMHTCSGINTHTVVRSHCVHAGGYIFYL